MSETIEVQPNTFTENKFKKYLPFATLLVGIGAAALVMGYGVGKAGSASQTGTKTTKGNTATLKTDKYTIEYPKDWVSTEHEEKEPTGAKISFRGNQVEFWQGEGRDYRFTDEQKANQKEQKESTLTIDGRAAKATEISFKGGSFFLSVQVPADEDSESVVFWLFASDESYKEKATKIVSSYKQI